MLVVLLFSVFHPSQSRKVHEGDDILFLYLYKGKKDDHLLTHAYILNFPKDKMSWVLLFFVCRMEVLWCHVYNEFISPNCWSPPGHRSFLIISSCRRRRTPSPFWRTSCEKLMLTWEINLVCVSDSDSD